MKRFLALLAFILIAQAPSALAQANIGTTSAQVLSELNLLQLRELFFGAFTAGQAGGEVRVDEAGTQVRGSVTLATPGERGEVQVLGTGGRTVALTIPVSRITLSDGSNTMQADVFLSGDTVTLDDRGNGNFFISGNLFVDANQNPGLYRATFAVNAAYS